MNTESNYTFPLSRDEETGSKMWLIQSHHSRSRSGLEVFKEIKTPLQRKKEVKGRLLASRCIVHYVAQAPLKKLLASVSPTLMHSAFIYVSGVFPFTGE